MILVDASLLVYAYRASGLEHGRTGDLHGLRLATHDHGFARFDGLRWFDPIQA